MSWATKRVSVTDKANEIIDRLNTLASDRIIQPNALEQIRFTVNNLRGEREIYFNLQGMIDSFLGDVTAVERSLELATREAGEVAIHTIIDFVVSLTEAGDPARAGDLLEQHADRIHEPLALARAASNAIALGRFSFAEAMVARLGEIHDESLSVDLVALTTQLAARGVTKAQASEFMHFVRSELRKHGIRRISAAIYPCAERSNDGPVGVLRYGGTMTPREAVELEESITVSAREMAMAAAAPNAMLLMLSPVAEEASLEAA